MDKMIKTYRIVNLFDGVIEESTTDLESAIQAAMAWVAARKQDHGVYDQDGLMVERINVTEDFKMLQKNNI